MTIEGKPDSQSGHGNSFTAKLTNSTIATTGIAILTVIAVFFVAKAMGSVLKPILFAWIISTMLAPLVKWLNEKCRLPYALAVTIAMILTILVIFEAGVLINSLLSSFMESRKDFTDKLGDLTDQLFAVLPKAMASELKEFDWTSKISDIILNVSGEIVSFSSTACMTLLIATFFFLEQRDIGIKLIAAFQPKEAKRLDGILQKASRQVSRYLILQFLISAATGICIWISLSLINIKFAAIWGILAFIFNFIPTVGSIVASIPPILMALVQYAPKSFWPAILATLAILTVQMTIGNIIAPRIFGDKLNISPAVIIISLLFWGWLWGIPGALISVPITASIKIVCDSFDTLRPIGILLGSGKSLRAAQNAKSNTGSRPKRHHRHFGFHRRTPEP